MRISFSGIFVILLLTSACFQAHAQTAAGPELFSACAACHGLDGNGGEHAPDIASLSRIQQMRDSELIAIVKNGITTAGMPSFGKLWTDKQITAVVQYLRVLQGRGADALATGDAARGSALFFGAAHCGDCHMAHGKGSILAADLSGYGAGHTAARISDAILAPFGNVNPLRGAISVVTQSKSSYTGIIRNEDNFSLQMQTSDGKLHLFDKAQLVRMDHEPEAMKHTARLSPSQLDDLIRFLSQGSTGKQPDDDQ